MISFCFAPWTRRQAAARTVRALGATRLPATRKRLHSVPREAPRTSRQWRSVQRIKCAANSPDQAIVPWNNAAQCTNALWNNHFLDLLAYGAPTVGLEKDIHARGYREHSDHSLRIRQRWADYEIAVLRWIECQARSAEASVVTITSPERMPAKDPTYLAKQTKLACARGTDLIQGAVLIDDNTHIYTTVSAIVSRRLAAHIGLCDENDTFDGYFVLISRLHEIKPMLGPSRRDTALAAEMAILQQITAAHFQCRNAARCIAIGTYTEPSQHHGKIGPGEKLTRSLTDGLASCEFPNLRSMDSTLSKAACEAAENAIAWVAIDLPKLLIKFDSFLTERSNETEPLDSDCGTESMAQCIQRLLADTGDQRIRPNMKADPHRDWPWHGAKTSVAECLGELTLIGGVSFEVREALIAAGLYSYHADNVEDVVGSTEKPTQDVKLEATARQFLLLNSPLYGGPRILPPYKPGYDQMNRLSSGCLRFYVDFELASLDMLRNSHPHTPAFYSSLPKESLIFMIGCGHFEESSRTWHYSHFFASTLSPVSEEVVVAEWLEHMAAVELRLGRLEGSERGSLPSVVMAWGSEQALLRAAVRRWPRCSAFRTQVAKLVVVDLQRHWKGCVGAKRARLSDVQAALRRLERESQALATGAWSHDGTLLSGPTSSEINNGAGAAATILSLEESRRMSDSDYVATAADMYADLVRYNEQDCRAIADVERALAFADANR